MGIRLVFSQPQPQAATSGQSFRVDAGDVAEYALLDLIAKGVLTNVQAILAIEDALTKSGETVEWQAERRILAMIKTLALEPVRPRESGGFILRLLRRLFSRRFVRR